MKVNLNVDKNTKEEHVDFYVREVSPNLQKIVSNLTNFEAEGLLGYKNSDIVVIKSEEIAVIYVENRKVLCKTDDNEIYSIKERLYEIEEIFCDKGFLRISSSSIINGTMIKKLMLDKTGSISVMLTNGVTEFVSRRNVTRIKEYIGHGGIKR